MLDQRPTLSERQLQVLELLAEGASLKMISAKLDLSSSRVNQLIREMKDSLRAQDRFGLVQAYRQMHPELADDGDCRKTAYTKSPLLNDDDPGHESPKPTAGEFVFSDVSGYVLRAPWEETIQPVVVPGLLDGVHAPFRRLVAIVAMAILIASAIVLIITAGMTVSTMWNGVGHVPLETGAPAD